MNFVNFKEDLFDEVIDDPQRRDSKFAIYSFFSGAGFLDLGFEKSGFETVFVNEFHGPFLDAYKYSRAALGIRAPMFGHLCDDIKSLLEPSEAATLALRVERSRSTHGLVGFVGGPPCPDFSVGGKNRGRLGSNGVLSEVYADLICQQLPDFFVFENVKGLWRTKVHRAFYEELKAKFSSAGYITTEKLINAVEYGAPQDRDRIILIGFRRSSFQNLPENFDSVFPWDEFKKFDRSILNSAIWPGMTTFSEGSDTNRPLETPEELTVGHWFKKNNVENHPNSKDCFTPRAALPRFQTIDEGDDSKKCFKRLHRWRFSPTAAYGNNEVHLHPFKARRISVAEALAIQSLPKEYVMPPQMTLTNKFKAVGNGVPFEAAHAIARSIGVAIEKFQ